MGVITLRDCSDSLIGVLRRPIICIVTRARGARGSPERRRLIERLALGSAAGASLIQVRERQLDDRHLRDFVTEASQAVTAGGGRVIVNDRTDIALAAGAAGVHLKSDGPSAADVRRVVPQGFLIGRSVHGIDEAREVEEAGGCDYLLFGTVFPSSSKPGDHVIAGIDGLRAVCAAVALPVVAIGGMTAERARRAVAAGADGIAAISLFAEATDITAAVESIRECVDTAFGERLQ